MRISKIEFNKNEYNVTLKPNWLERLLGIKAKTVRYKDTGATFLHGGGVVYRREDGTKLLNGSYIGWEIDKWRNRF